MNLKKAVVKKALFADNFRDKLKKSFLLVFSFCAIKKNSVNMVDIKNRGVIWLST